MMAFAHILAAAPDDVTYRYVGGFSDRAELDEALVDLKIAKMDVVIIPNRALPTRVARIVEHVAKRLELARRGKH